MISELHHPMDFEPPLTPLKQIEHNGGDIEESTEEREKSVVTLRSDSGFSHSMDEVGDRVRVSEKLCASDSLAIVRLPVVIDGEQSLALPIESNPQPALVEDDIEPLALTWKSDAPPVGAGLANLGNTCFLNAILQCITHTVPIIQKLRAIDHATCPGDDGNFCSFCTLRDHIEECLYMSGKTVYPESFAENLNKISSDFSLGNQEDAHEFLRCLLDSVHNSSIYPSWRNQPSSLETDSLVKQVFGGCLRSQLRCTDCGRCSDTFEPILDLSLEIEDVDNIQEALNSFTKIEVIDDPEAKFTCEGCNLQVIMEKQLLLDQVPEVVALHLKRFKNNGYLIEKIKKFVDYPLELDLKLFKSFAKNEVECKYDLYGIVVHMGYSSFGHYISIVRSSPTSWHKMDDAKVCRISHVDAMDQEAYILFYMKKGSSPWFSTLMETQKIAPRTIPSETSPTSVLDCMEHHHESPTRAPSCSNTGELSKNAENCSPPSFRCSQEVLINHRNSFNRNMTTCDDEHNVSQISIEPVAQKTSHGLMVLDTLSSDEDNKENSPRLPRVRSGHKNSRREGSILSPGLPKQVNLDASARRIMRAMPIARRYGFLACISKQQQKRPKQQRQESGSFRNSLEQNGSLPLNRKRMKLFDDQPGGS